MSRSSSVTAFARFSDRNRCRVACGAVGYAAVGQGVVQNDDTAGAQQADTFADVVRVVDRGAVDEHQVVAAVGEPGKHVESPSVDQAECVRERFRFRGRSAWRPADVRVRCRSWSGRRRRAFRAEATGCSRRLRYLPRRPSSRRASSRTSRASRRRRASPDGLRDPAARSRAAVKISSSETTSSTWRSICSAWVTLMRLSGGSDCRCKARSHQDSQEIPQAPHMACTPR